MQIEDRWGCAFALWLNFLMWGALILLIVKACAR